MGEDDFMIRNLISIFLIILLVSTSYTCTISVVSGKLTDTGKPMLFKNRDGSDGNYEVTRVNKTNKCITKDCYTYIAITKWNETKDYFYVYGGTNEKGFSIVNAVITVRLPLYAIQNKNLYLQQLALETCKDVKDFDNLLENWYKEHKDTTISSYYGVIDADNNAVLYKVTSSLDRQKLNIERYDVNQIQDGFYSAVSTINGLDVNNPNKDRIDRIKYIIDNVKNNNKLISIDDLEQISIDVCQDIDKIQSETININKCINSDKTTWGMVISEDYIYANLNNPIIGVFVPASLDYIPEVLYYDDTSGKNVSSNNIIETITNENKKVAFADDKHLYTDVIKEYLKIQDNIENNLQKYLYDTLYIVNIIKKSIEDIINANLGLGGK
jgi:hypothetical protein